MACDLYFIIKGEGLLKVTGNHIHWNSDNVSGMVIDRVALYVRDDVHSNLLKWTLLTMIL